MVIDHIFIFSQAQGAEADQLIDFGLTEGSHRVHPGQGTTNRKFYFENFFLEILWVHNEDEMRSSLTEPTKLWKRAQLPSDDSPHQDARFGLCLVNTVATDTIFESSQIYQPAFLPEEMHIDFVAHETAPHLPWTFRLPMKGNTQPKNEPLTHSNYLKRLTKATFGGDPAQMDQEFTRQFDHSAMVNFTAHARPHLWLEFDQHQQGKSQDFEDLGLTIFY